MKEQDAHYMSKLADTKMLGFKVFRCSTEQVSGGYHIRMAQWNEQVFQSYNWPMAIVGVRKKLRNFCDNSKAHRALKNNEQSKLNVGQNIF